MHVASMLERDELGADEVAVNVQAMSCGKPCLLRQLEDAWAICIAPLLGDGVTWRVRHSDLANLLPSKRRRALPRAGTAANQCSADMMFLHAARSTEHFFSSSEPRANNALAAASRVVQMNSTTLLGRAGAMTQAVEL